jgi:hypothetical protein
MRLAEALRRQGKSRRVEIASLLTPAIPASLPVDLDGDHMTDWVVVRQGAGTPAPITWYILNSAGVTSIDFGLDGDTFVPADYDGDGRVERVEDAGPLAHRI